MYKKITVGFVVQEYDDDGNPLHQEFIAGDEVTYEDENGETLDSIEVDTESEEYLPYHMIQPNTVIEIDIHGGLISEIGCKDNKLPGVKVVQRDYDVDGFDEDRLEKDEDGEDCVVSEYDCNSPDK